LNILLKESSFDGNGKKVSENECLNILNDTVKSRLCDSTQKMLRHGAKHAARDGTVAGLRITFSCVYPYFVEY